MVAAGFIELMEFSAVKIILQESSIVVAAEMVISSKVSGIGASHCTLDCLEKPIFKALTTRTCLSIPPCAHLWQTQTTLNGPDYPCLSRPNLTGSDVL